MTEFINQLTKNLGKNNTERILTILEKCDKYYDNSGLYSRSFAISIARNIFESRLDVNSIIFGIIYPVIKTNPDKARELVQDHDIKNIIDRLDKIENLNLSTHQEQLENIKKMFIALAKDIRVIIIKLCIEQAKLGFVETFNEIELAKYMQEVTDIYFPICQMLGLSHIKNSFGNATFKYYKPQMYKELTETLS